MANKLPTFIIQNTYRKGGVEVVDINGVDSIHGLEKTTYGVHAKNSFNGCDIPGKVKITTLLGMSVFEHTPENYDELNFIPYYKVSFFNDSLSEVTEFGMTIVDDVHYVVKCLASSSLALVLQSYKPIVEIRKVDYILRPSYTQYFTAHRFTMSSEIEDVYHEIKQYGRPVSLFRLTVLSGVSFEILSQKTDLTLSELDKCLTESERDLIKGIDIIFIEYMEDVENV